MMAASKFPQELIETDPEKIESARVSLAKIPFAEYAVKALADSNRPFFRRVGDTSLDEEKLRIAKELQDAGIDLQVFDVMLSNEIDRNLRKNFAWVFAIAAIVITLASYILIILNYSKKWGIHDAVMTAFIIEVPIQFIGILYIVAKDLFPSALGKNRKA